jgi:F-type H+-transporting ATPase subunit b
MININLTLIVQIVMFLLLLWVLNRLLYKPLGTMFTERTRRIEQGLAAAEQSRLQAEETQRQIQKQLDQARVDAQEILRQANRAADTMRESLTQEARAEAETIVRRAQAEIQRERQAAIADLRRQAGDLAILAASRVVGQSLDTDTNRRLVETAIGEI